MLIKILQLIASLSLLVVVHEFGHFIFAKMFKCRVEKFYLFFNPWFSIFKFRIGETTYGMGWVPFGGYVKISGMIDESMDTEALKEPPKPYEFRSKPAWQRLLIMVAGVFMNVILAAVIFIGMSYHYGEEYIANKDVVYGYEFNDIAHEIGFRNGDKILSVEGEEIGNIDDIIKKIVIEQASYADVEREGNVVRVNIDPSFTPRMLNDKSRMPFLFPRTPFVVADVVPGEGAFRGGMLPGDTIIAINSVPVFTRMDAMELLADNKGQTIDVTVVRNSASGRREAELSVALSDNGLMGVAIQPFTEFLNVSSVKYTLAQAVPAGFMRAGNEIGSYVKQLKLIFNPQTEAYKSVGGFIAIGNIFPDTWSWYAFWKITALLSIMLAVMNLLPIPALDGGHVMFLLFEVVTRRKPSDKFLERAQIVGLILLFGLLIFANGNDVYKLITKWMS